MKNALSLTYFDTDDIKSSDCEFEKRTELPHKQTAFLLPIGLEQWFSKFFHIPPLQTQTLSIPPQQR